MDKATWTYLLIVAAIVILLLAAAGLIWARPRDQVVIPFLITAVASGAIYAKTVHGASDFHVAFLACCGLAVAVGAVLVRIQRERSILATFSWALLGVFAPVILLIGLLTAVCAGATECLG